MEDFVEILLTEKGNGVNTLPSLQCLPSSSQLVGLRRPKTLAELLLKPDQVLSNRASVHVKVRALCAGYRGARSDWLLSARAELSPSCAG